METLLSFEIECTMFMYPYTSHDEIIKFVQKMYNSDDYILDAHIRDVWDNGKMSKSNEKVFIEKKTITCLKLKKHLVESFLDHFKDKVDHRMLRKKGQTVTR